jgi:membrane associated rhomboid family serine protease
MEELLQITPSPTEISKEWRAKNGICGNVICGKNKVEDLLAKWHPLNNLYVCPPNNIDFNLAIDTNELKEQIYISYVRRNRLSITMLVVSAMAIACIGWLHKEAAKIHLAFALASLVIFMILDYFVSTHNCDTLFERSRFYLLVRHKGRLDLIFWSGFMAIIGIAQILTQLKLGNLEVVLIRYGVYYKALENGEWWRLFTGPFLHANALHWSTNLGSFLLIGGISGVISRRLTVFTFLVSSAVGAYAGFYLSPYTHQDAYAGVSGGIFGIFGMCAGFSLCRPKDFPNKMGMVIIAFAAINIYISAAMAPNSSIEGHIAGSVVGLVLGALFARVTKFRTPLAQSFRAPAPIRSAHAPAADSPH